MADLFTLRQLRVMRARVAVLEAIHHRSVVQSISVSQALDRFVRDYKSGGLPADMLAIVKTANDRRRGISRETFYHWLSASRNGRMALLPNVTRQKAPPPKWVIAFMAVRKQSRTLADAYRRWDSGGFEPNAKPSLPAVRRAIRRTLTPDGFNALKASLPAGTLPSYEVVRRALTGT